MEKDHDQKVWLIMSSFKNNNKTIYSWYQRMWHFVIDLTNTLHATGPVVRPVNIVDLINYFTKFKLFRKDVKCCNFHTTCMLWRSKHVLNFSTNTFKLLAFVMYYYNARVAYHVLKTVISSKMIPAQCVTAIHENQSKLENSLQMISKHAT